MAFKLDNQTIGDLKIFGDNQGNDIYSLYNKTQTKGGAKVLKDMFTYPLSRAEEITARVNIIKHFRDYNLSFPFESHIFDTITFYLSNIDERTKLSVHKDNLQRKFDSLLGANTDYTLLQKGTQTTLNFLIDLKNFSAGLEDEKEVLSTNKEISEIKEVINHQNFNFLKNAKISNGLSYKQTVGFDKLFRFEIRKDIQKILQYIYNIDVYTTVATVGKEKNFEFAQIDKGKENRIEIKGMYHPLVPNAKPNDISIDEKNNIIFLTGANMAGKSTFMKTFSIAIYLAHVGFPLPVKSMRFSPQAGMFTTINLADNLNMGFSHFYAEVARVKEVANSVNANDNLIVVFDELFRGTNVKDAHNATVAIIDAFAEKRRCTFVVSTHIIEAGEDLKKMRDNIKFLYLPTIMNGNVPEYTYKITEGITSDRHGMVIIENERILDILKAQ